MNHSDHFKG